MKKLFSIICFIGLVSVSLGQTTGSFQQAIAFNQPDYNFTRTLYFYVPTNYDSNQSYPLVVGFRGGPHTNAGQFRDQLTFLSDSIGAIILCPENEDHFNNQEGLVKQLFQYSVDTIMAQYSIDPDRIYLTGLSYGGRHATIVSMDTDNGPIPNLRGVIPFAAGSNSHLEPDYVSVNEFAPACICIGLDDSSNFINVANTLHSDIQSNGGVSFLNEITGVGHTVVFPTYPDEMMECFNFIEAQHNPSGVQSLTSNSQQNVLVYPNPTKDVLRFKIPVGHIAKEVFIIDATGKRILSIRTSVQEVNVQDLSVGIYTLMVVSETSILKTRFTVAK